MSADLPTLTLPRPHPRTLGWVGTTALAMGGGNSDPVLLGRPFANQGQAPLPLPHRGVAPELGGRVWLDGAGAHVSRSCRRHRRVVRGGLPPLQPGAIDADWRVL